MIFTLVVASRWGRAVVLLTVLPWPCYYQIIDVLLPSHCHVVAML